MIGQEPSGSTHDIGSRGKTKKAKTKYAQIIQALGRDDVMKCCHIFPGRLFISPQRVQGLHYQQSQFLKGTELQREL